MLNKPRGDCVKERRKEGMEGGREKKEGSREGREGKENAECGIRVQVC